MSDIINGITGLISTIVTRIFPDRDTQIQAQTQLETLKANGELQTMVTNAGILRLRLLLASNGVWYNLIGLICTVALGVHLLGPLFSSHIPPLDMNTVYQILGAMLGVTIHTFVTKRK